LFGGAEAARGTSREHDGVESWRVFAGESHGWVRSLFR
jgi:hypothetical protein